jgi:hypothetical protein
LRAFSPQASGYSCRDRDLDIPASRKHLAVTSL